MKAATVTQLPAAWHALPDHLRKPFWTVNECVEGTGLSRSTLCRFWADPRSGFPQRRRSGGKRVHVNALDVLIFMSEG